MLREYGDGLIAEIIVVDGGSTDQFAEVSKSLGITVIHSEIASRAIQMNLGASMAKGNILYFVHADIRPVVGYASEIVNHISSGKKAGCFRYKFDSERVLLKINSWFTRFHGIFSGGGDQTLFIDKSTFNSLGGFNEGYCVMEDFEFVRRIKQKTGFQVLPKQIIVSSRKYDDQSWLRVQLANLSAFSLFLLKVEPTSIKRLYLNLLNQKKQKKE